MIIDSHNHVYYCGLGPEAVVAEMDALGIDRAWILTWFLTPAESLKGYMRGTNPERARPDGTHAAMPLIDVVATCKRYPDRFVPGFCPSPWDRSAVAQLEAAVKMHGVRVCGEWSYRMPLDDPRALELFRAAGRLKLPVVLHMDTPWLPPNDPAGFQSVWVAGTIHHLERALQACPETVFIGHAPSFWRELSGDADTRREPCPEGPLVPGGRLEPMFERYPNLWADLSANSGLTAMSRDRDATRRFLIKFADRLLFGRDRDQAEPLPFIRSLGLPEDVLAKILGGNALRLVPPRGERA
ncbi:MAG: amidohydrolase family protein [Planctomycetota bacterium]|nr:amidohydrolase family protein [Planctomycetota bacterium]